MKKIKTNIYTDGACKGNPGPGGWGVFLVRDNEEKEIFGGSILTTNNRMELLAVINGLKQVNEGETVQILTDSKYVKNGIEIWILNWIKNGWKTASKKPVANQDLWIELEELKSNRFVSWSWIKGHSGDFGNEKADYLANKGVLSVS